MHRRQGLHNTTPAAARRHTQPQAKAAMQLLARSPAALAGAAGLSRRQPATARSAATATSSRRALVCHAKLASKPPQSPDTHSSSSADATATALLAAQAPGYLSTHAASVNQPFLRKFAQQEAAFDVLLTTPDLDRRLASAARASADRDPASAPEDRALLESARAVEAAVAAAVRIAFTASAEGAPSAEPVGRCLGIHSQDEGCIVDWDSESLWDAAAASGSDRASLLSHDGHNAGSGSSSSSSSSSSGQAGASLDVAAAHTFLQRVLYKINRLNHFWYDDLSNYTNERSPWLARVREAIEAPWQEWELAQLLASPDVARGKVAGSLDGYRALTPDQLKEALTARFARDVDPPLSPPQEYVSQEMPGLGYVHLLAAGSVDGLVEASRQSRVCAGAANAVACTIFRVLMEEYGTGRYSRKHSTFYKVMMEELGMNTKEEAYLDLLPWQWLAAANQNFLLTERRRHYLRYAGALSFFEINGPSVYKTYLAAGRRCGLSESASGYWELHIKEDERHGRQMLEEVALPLVDMYPHDAWEMLLGYDQDRFQGSRAGAALVGQIQAAAAASAASG